MPSLPGRTPVAGGRQVLRTGAQVREAWRAEGACLTEHHTASACESSPEVQVAFCNESKHVKMLFSRECSRVVPLHDVLGNMVLMLTGHHHRLP